MSLLGNVGSLYMIILIFLLIIGLGLVAFGLIKKLFIPADNKATVLTTKTVDDRKTIKSPVLGLKMGGPGMLRHSNNWVKLALVSFLGLLLAVFALNFLMSTSSNNYNMANQMNSANQAYYANMQNGIYTNNAVMSAGNNGYIPNPNHAATNSASGYMGGYYSSMPTDANTQMLLQQIQQMQFQIDHLQFMLNNTNGINSSYP